MCHVVLSVAKYLFQMRFRDSSCRQNDKFAYCIDVGSTAILPPSVPDNGQ